MDINKFENLMDKCRIWIDDDKNVHFTPWSDKDEHLINQIIKDEQIEQLSLTKFQAIVDQYQPLYKTRQKLKQKKIEQFSQMSTQQAADLPLEQKLDYLEILFPVNQTLEQLMDVCKKNEKNIKACLFNIQFPESFWNSEKKLADRYTSLIARQPEITDKIKNWKDTSLDDKKFVIQQAAQVFKYIYGITPDIVFFTPEEEKAQRRALGLNEDAHINAAYFHKGKLHFNEERLQNSDNFFAISVLFHEGTHMRQHSEHFNDDLVNKIFNCHIENINVYENETNRKGTADYKDLYVMQPAEVHAHRLQEYIEQQFMEKTGIEKKEFSDLDKEISQIHNKAFSMAAISQYRSFQK